MGFATTAIHVGQEPDSATGAVSVPIYQTSTYAQEALGKNKGFEYARTSNPTRLALERNLAALEGAKFGYAFASGMAAIDATLRLIKSGEHVIVSDNTYGGTARLFTRILSNYGIEFDFVDTSEIARVEAAIKDNTNLIGFVQNSAGAILSPFDSWLVLRGTKTLALRMEQHDKSGRAIAAFLEDHPKVKKIYYAGSTSHKQHELAKQQQKGFGSMVSFDVGTLEAARTVLESVKVCTLAESLGGVESLICHPATMTHASVEREVRERLGITDGLVRISVGIEDTDDIIADLDQALEKVNRES